MRPGISSLFPILLMGLLAAMTFWLERAAQLAPSSNAAQRHDPDYFIENFTVERFDPQGKLQHTIVAKYMQHYPDNDSTDVTTPHITFHKTRQTVVTADTANIDSGGKTVVLNGHVRVLSNNPKGPPTEITSTTMTVFPDDEIAQTKAAVTITQGKSVLHGSGMHANNKTKIATLHGRATGTIAPKQ